VAGSEVTVQWWGEAPEGLSAVAKPLTFIWP
jgi:hypothetical protein